MDSPPASPGHLGVILEIYLRHRHELVAFVQRRFPTMCPGLVEDAVSEAFFVYAVGRSEAWDRAWQGHGEAGVVRMARVVAWRAARASIRRRTRWPEQDLGDLSELVVGSPPPQEAVLAFRRLDALIGQAVAASGAADRHALHAALEDSVATGDSDTAVAERAGVRREYLNRARRDLCHRLTEAS